MRLMVMQHYLDEELFINKEEMAIGYLRVGPKAKDLMEGRAKVLSENYCLACARLFLNRVSHFLL